MCAWLVTSTVAQSSCGTGRKEEGKGLPHGGQKVGLEKQVLNQFISVLVKEAILATLRPGQHTMGEAGTEEAPW